MSNSQPTGDCYEASCKFITTHGDDAPDQYKLVHGNIATLSQDYAVNHAWIEEGDTVHEVNNGCDVQFPKAAYYERFGVKNVRRYSYGEALIESVRAGHYGPWDEIEMRHGHNA